MSHHGATRALKQGEVIKGRESELRVPSDQTAGYQRFQAE